MKRNFMHVCTILFSFFVVMSFGVNSAQACDPLNCDPSPWTWTTRVVYLPDYPNCPITVGYRYRTCFGIITEIEVRSYSFTPSADPDCTDLSNDQQDAAGNPNWAEIGQTFRDLLTQLSEDLFVDFYNSLPNQAAKDAYDCENGTTNKTYTGVWGSCVEYEVCFNFPGPWTFEISECTDLLCCLQETTYCWDSQTNSPKVTETFTPAPDDCGTPSLSINWPCFTYGCVPFCEYEGQKGSKNASPIEGQFGTIYNLRVAPNPVEAEATITYSLSEQTEVEIVLFDSFGRQVATVFSGRQSQGAHRVNLPSENLINGMYTFQVRANGESATGSVILSR